MSADERIPGTDFDCIVGLTTTRTTGHAVERLYVRFTARPFHIDPLAAMASTSIHWTPTTPDEMPCAVRTVGVRYAHASTMRVPLHAKQDIPVSMNPEDKHNKNYDRPIEARYVDPCELIWLSTAKRLGMHIRRSPLVFSATDGSGRLQLSTRDDLDADDCLAQMLLHEICHWCTNGVDTFTERDWGFALDGPTDPREHAALRLQAWLADQVQLRAMFGPTGIYRQYYNRIPDDPTEPIDKSPWEVHVCATACAAIERIQSKPWHPHVMEAMHATAQVRSIVEPFLMSYQSEYEEDGLPSLWQA